METLTKSYDYWRKKKQTMIQWRTLQILENSRSVVNSRNFEDEANNVQLDKKDTQLKQLEYLSVTLVLKYPDILLFSCLFLVCLLIFNWAHL